MGDSPKSHTTGNEDVPDSYDTHDTSTAPHPQGSGRVDILTYPYTTAACAAGVVTVTASRGSSRWRYHGN